MQWIMNFTIGCCLFSFFDAWIYRSHHQEKIWKGRSHCDICQHPLAWKDLIPLISQTIAHSRCPYCHQSYSWSHFYCELLGGLCGLILFQFPFSLWQLWWTSFILYCIFLSLEDLYYHEIILVHWLLPLIIWSSIGVLYFHYSFYYLSAGVYFFLSTLCYLLFPNQFGFADILISMTFIFIFGSYFGLVLLYIASLLGILTIILSKCFQPIKVLPFIPYLCLGAILAHYLIT